MLNLGHELDTEELASWPHVKGILALVIQWTNCAKA